MNEESTHAIVGHIKSSHTYHWRIPQWSQLRLSVEYSSPPIQFDGFQWSIKLFKGKLKSPETLSIYVQIHETCPGSLRGVRKNVQLTLKIKNTNPSSYYNDFGVGKRLQPVWFSEKHTRWGEDALSTLSSIDPFLSRDQISLSVNITILKSEVASTLALDMLKASPPFARYIDSAEFSDIAFRVIEQECLSKDTGKLFHGHKNILAAVSPWFHMLFTNGMRESQQQEIMISGVKHPIFYRLLKYCYTFEIDMDGVEDAYEMLKASDQFQIVNIREEALRYLRQELNEDNIWDIWECADMYGCEKTIDMCVSYAGIKMKTLIAHPSWLYAKARVIKMALSIEVGDLPEEVELYEAVLLWAKARNINVLMPINSEEGTKVDITRQGAEVKGLSMTRTQLLSSVVNVEPLVISAAVIEDDEDEDETNDALEPKTRIDYSNKVIPPMDPQGLELDLAGILRRIRFPMMPPDFLVNRVESDPYIMSLEGMRDMLYEAYKYHAVLGSSPSSFRCQPRRVQKSENDESLFF